MPMHACIINSAGWSNKDVFTGQQMATVISTSSMPHQRRKYKGFLKAGKHFTKLF